jgi:superfamily II DNA helicase RecQ
MTRKVQRVPYQLDAQGIRSLPEAEIRAILRGADDLIMRGGRSLLVKILKGSRSEDVLSQSLDRSPAYGHLQHLPAAEVLACIDWVILNGYLTIQYDHRLPLLVYTERGWAIERETYAEELLRRLNEALTAGHEPADMSHLKDKNREVIWRLLDKLEASGDRRYISLLSAWEQIDYKKVRQRIRQVIERLSESKPEPAAAADGRTDCAGALY